MIKSSSDKFINRMVNFTVDHLRGIMGNPDMIRNLSVIAHVDHGKSTLSDSLIARAGIISTKNAGEERYMDTREDEKERGITIKSTGVSLAFNYKQQDYIFNLIDSPGHVDFSSEVTAALRVTDGAIVVVDTVEGVCVQTETVLRQAMQEKIRPVLMVNKVDKAILDLQLDGEGIYKYMYRAIERVNVVVNNFSQPDMGNVELDPTIGNVAFGSGKDAWGFTLKRFADLYAKKFNIPTDKLMKKFWGDNYFDAVGKKWRFENTDEEGNTFKRAFVQFIMDPIVKISKACISDDTESIDKLIKTIEITLTSEERDQKGKPLLKTIMQKWIDAADALLEMMILHLPSPRVAQAYRYKYLYQGPENDECAIAMKNCDANGPLMMYVSKMVPTSDKGRFYAFGRVFSGTVNVGQKVRIMGPNYEFGKKTDLMEKNIQRAVIMMGRNTAAVDSVPCGNTCALVGIDQALVKTGTISSHPEAHNIRVMKYSVSPVVRVAIKPKNVADLPKLIAGMQRLAKSDPLVLCINDEETGENIIAGSGELHVEICINDLTNDFAQIEIIKSDPIVAYRETVTKKSDTALCKSQNAHNRLYVNSEPLEEDFVKAIEEGEIPFRDAKEKLKTLEKFGFDKTEVPKIWGFGPDGEGPNIIMDVTSGCQFMNEIKEHLVSGFEQVVKAGVICEEPLRGVRFNVVDTTLHNDSIHRGGGQLSPTTRRVCFAAELLGKPTLQEPVFAVDISIDQANSGTIYGILGNKRGQVYEEEQVEGTPLVLMKAYLPVAESFGFVAYLRAQTNGKAFPTCNFDHWSAITGSLEKKEGRLYETVVAIRKRKGLKDAIPEAKDYIDKL